MERSIETPKQIKTVLVVDDDDSWCYVAKRLLKKVGFENQVMTAGNGLDALQSLRAIAARGEMLPEVIFLDIKMPVMNGFEFLEEIVKSTDLDLRNTRIFMCTSSFLPMEKERARLYPVAGFITKPLTQEQLRDILE